MWCASGPILGDVERLLLNTATQDGKRVSNGFGQDPGQAGYLRYIAKLAATLDNDPFAIYAELANCFDAPETAFSVYNFWHIGALAAIGRRDEARVLLLKAKGLLVSQGTMVDATIIHAPSSTKNAKGERDPEMHQTKKGNQWYFEKQQ